MNRPKIKICGMRDLDNIHEVVKLQPDYIGFIFYPKSKRFVDESLAKSIVAEIPESIKKVGVFVNELQSEVVRKAHVFKLDLIQLHGDETAQYCNELQILDLHITKAFGIDENFDFNILKAYEGCCEYFLFDTKSPQHGGTGNKFGWKILENYHSKKPFFLSGGIGPDDYNTINQLQHLNIYALDLNSRFEKEPAFKDIEKLRTFINEFSDK